MFSEWFAGQYSRQPTVADLDAENVNAWLAEAKASGRSAWTVSGYRRNILAIWTHAYQAGETDEPPLRLRTIRVPAVPIQAWTLNEIRRLDAAAARLAGDYPRGIRRATFWRTMVHAAYSTGLRRGDLLRLRRDRIAPNGLVEITQHKTNQVVRVQLDATSLAGIAKMASAGDPRAMPWFGHIRTFSTHFRHLVKLAGIRPGSLKWLRRSAASYCERDHPGSARHLLGHRSAGLADRYYLDRGICGGMPPSPPTL